MTAPERSRRTLDPSVRGLLVLAVVVVLGLLLLAKAAPSSSTTIATRDKPGPTVPVTTQPQTTGTTRPSAPPTTLGVAHPAAQVKVLVLNGTGGKIKLAAGTNAVKVKAKGYTTLPAGDAVARPKSAVFFAPGYHADAVAVGKVLNIPAASAVPVPTPSPAPNAGQANVIVLLGQDTPA
jgi:hypothetical protein